MTSSSCAEHDGIAGDEPLHELMRKVDAQFDRNERFPRPHGAVGWFAKFWPKLLLHDE